MDDEASRERIVALLKRQPGLHTRGVARELSFTESTADYHLRRLRREGRVVYEAAGRELRWFGAGCGLCPVLRAAIPELRRDPVARVALALDDLPTTATEVARRAGLGVNSARNAIDVLVASGVARKTASGFPSLREGADYCLRKAFAREACDRWGRCPPSLPDESGVKGPDVASS